MSWNNVVPWFIYELEWEEREAKMLGAMQEEIMSGRTRSTPEHWHELDYRKWQELEVQLVSLGIRL
jgi:hypothetical protein